MAASVRLLFGAYVFNIRRIAPATASSISNTLLNNPSTSPSFFSLCFPKTSLFPRIKFHCYSSSAAVDSLSDNNEAVIVDNHPWPEWVTFLDRLKRNGYFDEASSLAGEFDGGVDGSANATTTGVNPRDITRLKNACLSFARDRFDIFKLLSRNDIKTVVEYGCPSLLRKAVNSAKRLRVFVRLDEGDVCSACNLRGSCDRAYVIVKESEAAARTVDIVRVLLLYALDPIFLSGGEKPHGKENIEVSARKLLSELIELSDTPPDPALPRPNVKPSHQEDQIEKITDIGKSQNVEMKRGDWMCSKCSFMNFARNVRCLRCKEEGPKRVSAEDIEMKKGDWNCAKCGFMNFARNSKCFRCQEGRKRILNPGEWECPSCDFLNYRRDMVCLKCNCKRPNDEAAQYEDRIWKRPG